ncbi:MAG: CHASE domain-containing protein [Gammaproteobacteria bacterium]|nr:CHASE domain-containing protein [Gammaproteobacteria bacterium]
MQSNPNKLANREPPTLQARLSSLPVSIEIFWLQISLLTISYTALALLSSLLASGNAYTAPLWPAAGLALAGLLMCGNRCWPGIWLGALLADLILQPFSIEILPAVIIATGVTLQAVLGAILARQFLTSKLPLSRENDIIAFLLLVGPLACLVSASFGTFALYSFGKLPPSEMTSQWLIWYSSNTAGVLLFTPIILLAWPGSNAFWPRCGSRVVLPLLITAILLAAGNMIIHSLEKTRAMDFTNQVMNESQLSSFYHLPDIIEPLRGVERFITASENISRKEFATYTDYFHHHPAILSVDWAPRISAEKAAEFIATIKADGFTSKQIFELDLAGNPVPAASRDEYLPVIYSEPIERNRSIIGLNHGFEPPRVLATERARDTGELSATSVIPLLRTNIRAVLTFYAVYQNGLEGHNLTLETRRESLRGFVVGVVDISKLFDSLVQTAQQKQLVYRVTDITPGEPTQIIVDTIPTGITPEWMWQEQFANRTWQLEMQPINPLWHSWTSFESRFYLGFSMLAAFLVAFSALGGAGRQAATSLEVEQRTADLQRELHARAIAEAALRLSEQDLNITLRSIGDAVLATDANRCITRLNPVAEKLTGWSQNEARGLSVEVVFNIINEETRAPALIPVDDVLNSGEIHGLANHTVLIARDGSEYHIADSAAPIRDNDGVIRGVVLVFRDVGEEREITHQIEQAREDAECAKKDAEQASRAKSAFLATMSHEIRTPMNGVLGLIDVLSYSQLSVHQVDLVTTIRQSATTLLTIIDEILDFSKIEAGRLEIEHIPVSIVDLVEGLCNSLNPLASRKGVDLALFISPEVPEWLLSDDVRLRQMLYNLIGNAIKFSGDDAKKPGRVYIRITIASQSPLKLTISITDNGIGMTPETVGGLFTPFSQAEASTTRRFGGSGLGLAICKRLANMMHGDISVESKPNQGSTFTLTLPFEIAEQQSIRQQQDLSEVDAIIVESTEFNADDIRQYLEHAGAQVKLVANIESICNVIPELTMPVVVQHIGNEKPLVNPLLDDLGDIRYLMITSGQRRRARVESSTVVSLDGNALRRQALIRAVAVAAGKASPEIFQQSEEFKLLEGAIQTPTIDEARAYGRLILVAEDDEANRKVITQQLALLGYVAEIACNGVEALTMWRKGGYALLLTDLHMPEMDGYTLSQTIRQEEAGQRHIPILAFTANAIYGESSKAHAAGMDGYLTKPVQLQLLRTALEKWLPAISSNYHSSTSTQRMDSSSIQAILDVAILKSMVGNDADTLRDFLSSFLENLQIQTRSMTAAFTSGDHKLLATVVHKLKSSSYAVGAQVMGNLCEQLEASIKADDKTAVSQTMKNIESAQLDVSKEIRRLLDIN